MATSTSMLNQMPSANAVVWYGIYMLLRTYSMASYPELYIG